MQLIAFNLISITLNILTVVRCIPLDSKTENETRNDKCENLDISKYGCEKSGELCSIISLLFKEICLNGGIQELNSSIKLLNTDLNKFKCPIPTTNDVLLQTIKPNIFNNNKTCNDKCRGEEKKCNAIAALALYQNKVMKDSHSTTPITETKGILHNTKTLSEIDKISQAEAADSKKKTLTTSGINDQNNKGIENENLKNKEGKDDKLDTNNKEVVVRLDEPPKEDINKKQGKAENEEKFYVPGKNDENGYASASDKNRDALDVFDGDEDGDKKVGIFEQSDFGNRQNKETSDTLNDGKVSQKYTDDDDEEDDLHTQSNVPIGTGPFVEAEDSHFFVYFITFTCLTIVGYIAFHNKSKILALVLEGRRSRATRRRPNSASYHKLQNNLEQAITSHPPNASSHTIY